MKVYGVYRGTCEGWFLQDLFMKKSDALKKALELLQEEMVETKEMQEYCKNDHDGGTDYKNWQPSIHAKDRWDGDFEKSIAVEEVEVIE